MLSLSDVKVTCVGGVALDRIFLVDQLPEGTSKTVARDFAERGGGMAATAAVAIAALGGSSRLVARVGGDMAGEKIIAELTRAQVMTDTVLVATDGRTATSAVLIDNSGERMLTNFKGHLPTEPDWIPLDHLRGQSAVLADVRWLEGASRVLESARKLAVPTILDADAGDPAILPALSAIADHVVFSEQGLAQVSPGEDLEQALRDARRFKDQIVAVTLGERGSLWLEGNVTFHLPAPAVEAVNSNGVGDTFHGAYALAIGSGMSVCQAGQFATLAAAAKCCDPRGWEGMPTLEKVRALDRGAEGPFSVYQLAAEV